MNVLRTAIIERLDAGLVVTQLQIDGVDLVELVRAVEHPFAVADGTPGIAGGYDGLHPARWLELPTDVGTDTSVDVLGCSCGELACWPLRMRLRITDETVTWSEFRQPWREHWRHEGLGPFVFDRAAYLAECERLRAS